MENQWSGQFTFEDIQTFREKAENDISIKADVTALTGDVELTEMIFNGPDEAQLSALRTAAPDDTIHSDFDAIWGEGAAEYYKVPDYSFLDHISEIPGAAVRGVAGAVAETGEMLFNTWGTADVAAREAGQAYAAYVAEQRGEEASEAVQIEPYEEKEWDADTILRGAIAEPDTMTGQITEGIVQFAAPFLTGMGGASKLVNMSTLGVKAKLAVATFVGMVTDYSAFDEDDPLMTVALADYFGVESEIIDNYLRHGDDDSDEAKRLRRAIEGGVVGIGTDMIMVGILRGIRKVRSGSATVDEVSQELKETLDALEAEEVEHVASSTAREEGEEGAEAATEDVSTEKPVEDSQEPTWHFQQDTPKESPDTTKGDSESVSEGTTAKIEDLPPKFEDAAKALGEPDAKPKVGPKEHAKAIRKASVIYRTAQRVDAGEAWNAVREVLAEGTDTLAEAGVRTREQIKDAVLPVYRKTMDMVLKGDLEGLTKMATADGSILSFRIRSAALQGVTKYTRSMTDKLVDHYNDAVASNRLTAHETAVLRDMVHKQIQFAMEVEALNSNMGSASGALLGQRANHMDWMKELQETAKSVKEASEAAGKSAKEIKKAVRKAIAEKEAEIIKRVKRESSTHDARFLSDRYRELVRMGVDPSDAFARVKDLAQESRKRGVNLKVNTKEIERKLKKAAEDETKFDTFLRGLEQWRYNAMLSGLKTHMTNFLSSAFNMGSRLAYEAAWGTFDKDMRKAVYRKVVGMTTGMKDSLYYAIEAWKQMKPILDSTTAFERFDPAYGKGTGLGAQLITYPSRLMLASDQFIKQLTYRGEVHAAAHYEADLAGLTGAKRDAFVKKRMDEAFTEDGAATDMLAMDRANEVTFQKDFDPRSQYMGERVLAKANSFMSNSYLGRFLFPFMRIYFRLTSDGIRLTPGLREGVELGVRLASGGRQGSRYGDDFFGKNGKTAQARAVAEFGVGLSIVAWTMSMVAEGKITGGEERHYVDAMMRRKVIPPYHIYVNGEWYDYSRFEPLAFPFKFWSNTLIRLRKNEDAAERGEYEKEGQELMANVGAWAMALGEAVTNNSFMEGLESLTKVTSGAFDNSEAWKRPVHTAADSYVPNILRKINQSFDDTGNKYVADPLTLDAFKRHFSSVIDMSEVDLERNQFTGEPYEYTDVHDADGHMLFVGKPPSEDKAMKLLIEANENTGIQPYLTRPGAFMRNTDLRDFPQDGGGRSLYDQYQEVFSTITDANGKTYRDRLEELADNPEFNDIPWGNKTRVRGTKAEIISELKSEYEGYAKKWMENNSKAYSYLLAKQHNFEQTQARKETDAHMKAKAFFLTNQ